MILPCKILKEQLSFYIRDLLTIPFSLSPAYGLALQRDFHHHCKASQEQVEPTDFWHPRPVPVTEMGPMEEALVALAQKAAALEVPTVLHLAVPVSYVAVERLFCAVAVGDFYLPKVADGAVQEEVLADLYHKK